MADSSIKVRITGDSSSAQKAINEVGAKAESVLGKRLGGMFTKAMNALPFAGMAAGVGLVANEVVQLGAKITGASDNFALMRSRLNMINDGAQSTDELLNKVYASANRARGSFEATADVVGKLGILAKDAFSNNDEIILFAEQMNKQFKIGGASLQEQQSAMYQLTQAMAAGKLQGDEFRSIMENAPLLAQSIANEFGMSVGQLKEMSSEGLITSDIIKNALFNSAEETNAKFAELPMTFEDIATRISNAFTMAFQPVLTEIGTLANSESMQTFINGLIASFKMLSLAVQGVIATIRVSLSSLSTVLTGTGNMVKQAFSVFPAVAPVAIAAIAGITGAMIASRVATTALTVRTLAHVVATNASRVAQVAWNATMAVARGITLGVVAVMWLIATATNAFKMATISLNIAQKAYRAGALLSAGATAILNAIMSANPIPILIGLLVAVTGYFLSSSIAADGFGGTLKKVWNSIVHTSVWAVNKVIGLLNSLISVFNKVGKSIASALGKTFEGLNEISEISADDAQELSDAGATFIDGASEVFSSGGALNAGGGESSVGAGGGGSKGHKGGGGGGRNSGMSDAKQLHDRLVSEYNDMFKTKKELVDEWLKKETEELEKSKANNLNYEKDKLMIAQMYAKKREQALLEEAKRAREIQRNVRDLAKEFNLSLQFRNTEGDNSPMVKLRDEYETNINAIRDKWQSLIDDFAEMTEQDKQTFIEALKEKKIAFELTANGQISFERAKNEQLLAAEEDYIKRYNDLVRTNAEIEFQLKEAYRTGDTEAFMEKMNTEYVETQKSLELRQSLMDAYQEATMQAQWNAQEVMFEVSKAGFAEMEKSISGLIMGTKTLGDAIAGIGKALAKTFADMVAQWMTAQLKQAVFGKMMMAKNKAMATADGAAITAAYTPAALTRSMATGGASAMAGEVAFTTALSTGMATASALSIPKFAKGGTVSRPTLALIGENKEPETVVPHNAGVFDKLAEGIASRSDGANQVNLHVSALDASSFDRWLRTSGGKVMSKYFNSQRTEFKLGGAY